jgi:hypothetical protein
MRQLRGPCPVDVRAQQAAEKLSDEGHGFSRAVQSHSYEGLRACVKITLSKLSP